MSWPLYIGLPSLGVNLHLLHSLHSQFSLAEVAARKYLLCHRPVSQMISSAVLLDADRRSNLKTLKSYYFLPTTFICYILCELYAKCIVATCVCVSVCLSVCMSAVVRPHYCTDLDVTWGRGRGCPLVVHCWTDLQSTHGLRCYGNITRTLVYGGVCARC